MRDAECRGFGSSIGGLPGCWLLWWWAAFGDGVLVGWDVRREARKVGVAVLDSDGVTVLAQSQEVVTRSRIDPTVRRDLLL